MASPAMTVRKNNSGSSGRVWRFLVFAAAAAVAVVASNWGTGSVGAEAATVVGSGGGGGKKKESVLLAEKVSGLNDMSASSHKSVLRFNGQKFNEYVKSNPRNYSIVVMFTALSASRQCAICKQAADEFAIVADSFRFQSSSSGSQQQQQQPGLYFAMVDFDDGPDVFQLMKLNSAPVFMHFPAKGKPKREDTMDIQRVAFASESIAKWIAERTDINIRVVRPPNYAGVFVLIMLLSMVACLLYLRRNNLEFLQNKTAWGMIALAFVFCMISGQMWNHIRGPAVFQKTRTGVSYIHGSSQGQFLFETYFIMAIYALIAFGIILMIEAAQQQQQQQSGSAGKSSSSSSSSSSFGALSGGNAASKRKVMAGVGLALFAIFFSLILSIFRSKAGGYPYSFLFK